MYNIYTKNVNLCIFTCMFAYILYKNTELKNAFITIWDIKGWNIKSTALYQIASDCINLPASLLAAALYLIVRRQQ